MVVLEESGVIRWPGRREVHRPYLPTTEWTGGAVALTAFGRHVVPDYLDQAGYRLRRVDRIAEWDAADLIAAMLLLDNDLYAPMVAHWQTDLPVAERVQMLTEAIVATPNAAGRVAGFAALNEFDIEVTEPWVRQLLDTSVSGHAALWLVSRGCADAETLAGFVDTAVFVDTLASNIDEPAVLSRFFTGPEPQRLIEGMWQHSAPETAALLDALGRHLADPALAKAARRAAVRHRSWMANRSAHVTSE